MSPSERLISRAVRFHEYGPPSVLVLEEVARPEPEAGEVLVRVHAAAVNPIDWKFRAGYLKDFAPLELPHTVGYDLAGAVEVMGSGVADFAPGDAVFGRGTGAYADFAIAPVDSLAHRPDTISFEQAATLPIGRVAAWAGLFDAADLRAGQRLLVQGGAGGVGSLAVQLGRWKGAHVAATTSTGNIDYVKSLGADEVIDYTTTRFEDAVRDVDVVLDCVGGDVSERSWGVLKKGGILVVIAGRPDPDRAATYGVRTAGVPQPESLRAVLEELAALVEAGTLIPPVGKVFPLADAAQAHAASETGHGRGRIVLRVLAG